MITWSFYRKGTGLFTGRSFGGPVDLLEANTPPGCGAVAGVFDRLSQRVDTDAVAPPEDDGSWQPPVIDYRPPAPPSDEYRVWVWDEGAKRWVDEPTLAAEKNNKRKTLRAAAKANACTAITVQNVQFDADDEALADLSREALFARLDGAAFTLTWQRSNGAFVRLNDVQTIALARAIRDRAEAIRQQLRDRLQDVAAAQTIEALLAITWSVV